MERTKSLEIMRNLSNIKNNTTAMPIIAAAAGHIIWGFSFLLAKVAMQSAEAPVYLSIRFILALFLLTMMVVCGREKLTFRGKNWTPMILLCIAEPLYFYFESYGIYYTNATFAGVILAVVPVVSMVVAAIFLKEYPSRRKALFSIIPVIGVIVMTIAGEELGIIRPIGVVLLICCCISSAVYKTANRGSAAEFTTFERTYYVILVCTVVFTIDAFRTVGFDPAKYLDPLSEPSFVVSVVMLAVFCSIVSGFFVNYAAARMSVVNLATIGTLMTITAAFAGVIFLKEPVSAMSLAGTVLILYGIRQVTKPE